MLGKAIQSSVVVAILDTGLPLHSCLLLPWNLKYITVLYSVLSVIISAWVWQQSITSGHKCAAPLQGSWGCYRLFGYQLAMLSSAADSLTRHVIKDCGQLIYHGRVQTPASRYNIHCCSPQWLLQVMTLIKVATEFRINFHYFIKIIIDKCSKFKCLFTEAS